MVSGYNLEQEILIYAKLHKYFPLLSGYDHGWAMREFNAIASTKKINRSIIWFGIKELLKELLKSLIKKFQ